MDSNKPKKSRIFWLTLLRAQVEMFGIREALHLFFEVMVKWEVQDWVWLNITHKLYCTYHGWHCEKDCIHPKLLTKKEILAHRAEGLKEIQKVEVGPDGKCVYCGEFKGIQQIPDPNGGMGSWLVCVTCSKVIAAQGRLSFGMFLLERAKDETSRVFAEKVIKEAKDELSFLEAESFMPTFTAVIRRNENADSNK